MICSTSETVLADGIIVFLVIIVISYSLKKYNNVHINFLLDAVVSLAKNLLHP